jgi:hypothetical protein
MKRTLTALTAIVFAGAMALPAFAQMGMNSNPASSTSSSSTSESSSQYRATQPDSSTNSVERTERDYKSERNEVAAPAQPPEQVQSRVERKESTSTTTEAAPPPPPVESSTTTTTTHRTDAGY